MSQLEQEEMHAFEDLVHQFPMITPNAIAVSCVTAVNYDGEDEKIYMLSFHVVRDNQQTLFNFAVNVEVFEDLKLGLAGAEAHMLKLLGKEAH